MANKDFKGKIGFTVRESQLPDNGGQKEQKNQPNVVYIVLDDVGFAHLGAYGSDISTPNIDRLANGGLRYNNFHTTAICSPTRASLLTGQNPHTAGVSYVTDFVNGYPNKQGFVSANTALISEILQENGYSTFAVGKWHLSPTRDNTFNGPLEQWPLNRGFDHFYGFLNGETNQYTPDIVLGNDRVTHPKSPEEGYHLTEDLSDKFIEYVGHQKSSFQHKPFFGYLAFGAGHAPHQVPSEFIEKYKGKYDIGWDAIREKWFNRQKELGIVPENTELAPLTDGVTPWNELSDDQKRLYARSQEVFAGFLEHTDYHIGRVIHYLEEIGELDNTIIVLISDNGASREGGYHGTWNEWKNFALPDMETAAKHDLQAFKRELSYIDDLGSPKTYNHYPTGWALAGNTPLRWYKTYVYAGGVRDPLIIHYPNGIADKGEIRTQYSYVSDITPTVLDLLNIEQPQVVKNVEQIPFAGKSIKYSFDKADAPSQRTVQHFELFGHRAIYKDGWKALTRHTSGADFDTEEWSLFHLAEDFSETNNVAHQFPEKLAELKQVWQEEAEKYDVFPIDDAMAIGDATEVAKSNSYMFYPTRNFRINTFDTRIKLYNHPLHITATLTRESNDEGVLFAQGSQFGGFVLFIQENRLVFHYSRFGEERFEVISNKEVPVGHVVVQAIYEPTKPFAGNVTIKIGDEKVGELFVEGTTGLDGPGFLTIGENIYTAIAPSYEAPYRFTGKLHHVKVDEPKGGLLESDRIQLELSAE